MIWRKGILRAWRASLDCHSDVRLFQALSEEKRVDSYPLSIGLFGRK